MVKKCECGRKIIPYPIWRGQIRGEKFAWNKIYWYNFLIGNWTNLLLMLGLLGLLFAYSHDTEACRDILENPCEFVELNQQACFEQKKIQDPNFVPSIPGYEFVDLHPRDPR